jgi:hypothetical protein
MGIYLINGLNFLHVSVVFYIRHHAMAKWSKSVEEQFTASLSCTNFKGIIDNISATSEKICSGFGHDLNFLHVSIVFYIRHHAMAYLVLFSFLICAKQHF